uniref:Uncharacterized protein n=1 Tax=Acidobacterium capsulatum TaxID=33075 RepID=A0A7V4XRG2_9BACT
MRILFYLLSILVLWGVYELGSMAIQQSREWSLKLNSQALREETLRKSFIVSGKVLQAVALVWGFLDVVAVLLLLTDFVMQ